MRFWIRRVMGMLLIFGTLAMPTWAQQGNNQSGQRNTFSGSPLFWSTESVLELYVRQMTRHYNLTEEQEEYTRKLLTTKVKAFLTEHEQEVRPMIAEYWRYQMSRELPDPVIAQDFARKARPLVESARKEIMEGNTRWRNILNDRQKALHDSDLQQMTIFFDNLETGLKRWESGDVRPMDVGGRVNNQPGRILKPEDSWDFWLRQYIKAYNLDEGQQQTAYSILRELKQEAQRYRDNNKNKFEEIESASTKIVSRQPKSDPQELKKYQEEFRALKERQARLEKPIDDLFEQLRSRVDLIPTADQRRIREEARQKILRERGLSPTTSPTTEPAKETTDEPATTPAE